jgi:hypothetical protein
MPYGNINYQKRFYYTGRFTYKDFVLQKYIDDIQFCFSQERLLDCDSIVVEVREDDGGTKQTFEYVGNNIDKASILAFVGANNGYISKWTDQVTGDVVEITTEAQQQQIVNAGAWIDYTAKYNLEIPVNTALTVSGIAAVNRMKNLNMCSYIAFKDSVFISGYTSDYVFPINCSAGLMDFEILNSINLFWYDADGNISTATRPSPTLVNEGTSYLFATNIKDSTYIFARNTYGNFRGKIEDVPDMIGRLTITSTHLNTTLNDVYLHQEMLSLYNNPDFNVNIHTYAVTIGLANSYNFNGIIYFYNPGISFLDITQCNHLTDDYLDTIIINLDNTTIVGGQLLIDNNKRTSASDVAVNSLVSKGWTITEI